MRTRLTSVSPALGRRSLLLAALVGLPALVACGGSPESGGGGGEDLPRVAFVTNCIDPFWDLAGKGAAVGAGEFGLALEFYAPHEMSVDLQKRKLEDLLARGIDGIAISPVDAANMVELVDEACARTHLITHDSDAPGTARRCFVGCDNYAAGRACGQLVKEALPDGGTVMLFIGNLEQDNAKKRRQGVIDELLDRAPDAARFDPNAGPIEGERFTILDTRTDNGRKDQAKANAEDTLARYPDIDGMVGLFAYNPPACLEALRAAERVDAVKLIGFDEDRTTVQAILDGEIWGTVSQNPYSYGYESMRVLAGLIGGDESVLPADGVLTVEHAVYRRDSAGELLALLDDVLGK